MLPGMAEPTITLFGICWLCSLPCLASFISILVKQAQFLPAIIWASTSYNLFANEAPEFFVIGALSFSALHFGLWFYEEYYLPARAVDELLGLVKG